MNVVPCKLIVQICQIIVGCGLLHPKLVLPAAVVVAVLMVGAVAMHFKVGDPFKNSVPALSVLVLCVIIIAGHWPGR